MVQNILVVGKSAPYDFTPEGGTRLTGQKIHYILMNAPLVGEDAEGFQPVSASLPLDKAKKIKKVPARYDAGFAVTMKDGKPQIKLIDVDEESAFPVEL